jgi:hypothetical protein
VRIDEATARQCRAGLALGYAGKGRWLPHLRGSGAWSAATGGGVHAEGSDFAPCFDGFRAEAGGGFAFRINAASQAYVDYEYARARLNYAAGQEIL